jgi:hypothetical protein
MQRALGSFLRAAIIRAQKMFSFDPSDADLKPFFSVMDYLVNQLSMLQAAIRIAFMQIQAC